MILSHSCHMIDTLSCTVQLYSTHQRLQVPTSDCKYKQISVLSAFGQLLYLYLYRTCKQHARRPRALLAARSSSESRGVTMDRDRRVSANRGCDSYVKAILRALRAPAQVEVEPAEPAVAEPAPPDELHLTSSHTDKLIAQLLKRAESKPADEAACAPADAPADDSADDSEDDSREDGRSHNGVRRAGVPRRSW